MKRNKSKWERIIAYLLCAVMLLTSVPVSALAGENIETGVINSEEGDGGTVTVPKAEPTEAPRPVMPTEAPRPVTPTEAPAPEPQPTEAPNPQPEPEPTDAPASSDAPNPQETPMPTATPAPTPAPTEIPKRVQPVDWTNRGEVLTVNLDKLTYEDKESGTVNSIQVSGGRLDLTALPASAENLEFVYGFRIQKTEKEEHIQKDDTFSMALPVGSFSFRADAPPLLKDEEHAPVSCTLSGDVLKVTLKEAVDGETFTQASGEVRIPASLRTEVLTEETQERSLLLQTTDDGQHAVAFVLPAKSQEENQEPIVTPGPTETPAEPGGQNPEDPRPTVIPNPTETPQNPDTPEDPRPTVIPNPTETPQNPDTPENPQPTVAPNPTETPQNPDTPENPQPTQAPSGPDNSLPVVTPPALDGNPPAGTPGDLQGVQPGEGPKQTPSPSDTPSPSEAPELSVTPDPSVTPKLTGTPEEEEDLELNKLMMAAEPTVSVAYRYGDYNRTAEAVAAYLDNHNQVKKRPNHDTRLAAMKPYFTLSVNSEEYPLTAEGWAQAQKDVPALDAFSMPSPSGSSDSEDSSGLTIEETERGTNGYLYRISNLPGTAEKVTATGTAAAETAADKTAAAETAAAKTASGEIGSDTDVDNPAAEGKSAETVGTTKTETETITKITYQLKEEITGNEFDGYINEYDSAAKTYYHHIETAFTAKIELRDGNQHYLSNALNTLLANLTLNGKRADGTALSTGLTGTGIPLSSFTGSGNTYTYQDGKAVYTLSVSTVSDENAKNVTLEFKISGLAQYTRDDEEIIYTLTAATDAGTKEPLPIDASKMTGENGDFYGILYDNAASSNFGSVTDTCHDGGTVTYTLEGKTAYNATKMWLDEYTGKNNADDKKKARPALTFYLWRYALQGEIPANYTQAAQVKDDAGVYQIFEWNKDKDQTADSFDIKFPAAEGGFQLPKYDPEGYRYVYLLREEMDGASADGTYAYEQVFGEVNTDGSISGDKQPGGKADFTAEAVRPGGDKSVYNNGIISNRMTGTAEVGWKKIWKAAYHQNDLNNVEVTLQLQSRPKDSAEDAAWAAVTDSDVMITNFISEQLIQSGISSAPAYDFLGRPLEYRFVESKVTELIDGKQAEVKPDDAGRYRFVHNQTEIAESIEGTNDTADDEYYVSETVTEDGVTTVTNRLEGSTTYTVDKLWNINDGKKPVTYSKKPPADDATATVQLKQDNKKYDPDAEGPLDGTAVLTKKNAYYYQYAKLPKYDGNGTRYTYVVEECKNSNGWHPDYTYDVYDPDKEAEEHKHYDAQIKNDPVGPGKVIKIKKVWLDDGDESHREPVTMEVYRKARDVETADVLLGTCVLTVGHGWWTEFGIKKDDMDGEYYVKETKVGSHEVVYPEPGNEYTPGSVSGSHHIYTVAYQKNGDGYYEDGCYTVVNRRIGTVNMTVTKTWVDGENEKNERGTPVLKLSELEEGNGPQVTITDTGSEGTVTVTDGGALPIQDKDGNPAASKQTVDTTTADPKDYCFFNLPKYDSLGRVIHYTVEELDGAGEVYQGKDYVTTIEQTSYMQGADHFNGDDQKISVENKKTGTRPVVFKKQWHDRYVNKVLGKRPDIYLDLYSASNTADPTPTEYRDRKWSREPGDSEDYWTCTFPNLPKYDDDGYEITYYAEEKSMVNRSELDYLVDADSIYRFKVKATGGTETPEYPKNETVTITAEEGEAKEVLKEHIEDETGIAVSDGTFINAIGKPITIQGKKVWKSVPEGTAFADLPELTIHVDQDLRTAAAPSGKSVLPSLLPVKAWAKNQGISLLAAAGEEDRTDLVTDIVEPYTLTKDDGTDGTYSFLFTEDKTKKSLQKYNEDGDLYIYEVREEVTDATKLEETAYEKLPGEVNDYIITNTYATQSKNTGELRVEKTWAKDGKYTISEYPAVEFTLYQQYESKDPSLNVAEGLTPGGGKMTEPKKLGTVRVGAATETSVNAVFEDLRIKAPNGSLYYYYVEEKVLNGYTAAAGGKAGAISAKVALDKKITPAPDAGSDNPVMYGEAAFTNTYQNPDIGKVSLTMEKHWEDYDHTETRWFGIRPDVPKTTDAFTELFQVERYAAAQPGTKGALAIPAKDISGSLQMNDKDGEFYLAVEETKARDAWTITISNLDRYAGNSMPWRYKITETVPAGYVNENPVSDTETEAAGQGATITPILMEDMTNTSMKSASVTKKWAGTDNLSLKPNNVTVKLQMRQGIAVWIDADKGFSNEEYSAICAKNKVDGLADNAITVTGSSSNNSWATVTVKNLPAYRNTGSTDIPDFQPLYYRFVETKIGKVAVTFADPNEDTDDTLIYGKTGVYTPAQMETKDTSPTNSGTDTTAITNRAAAEDVVSLKVTKKWIDSEDAYDTRPASIQVKLQRRDIAKKDAAESWEDVKAYGDTGAVLIEKIPISNSLSGETEATYVNLPKKSYDGTITYEYRAVEVVADESGNVAEIAPGGKNGDYTVTYDHTENASVITNTLAPTSIIEATKFWKTGDAADKKPVYLELQYKESGDAASWQSYSTRQIVKLDGTADAESGNKYELEPWTAKWIVIPAKDDRTYRVAELTKEDGTAISENGTLALDGKKYFVSYTYPEGTSLADGLTLTAGATSKISVQNIEKTSHTVKKEWADTGNIFKDDLPDSVTFALYRTTDSNNVGNVTDSEKVAGKTVTINKPNDTAAWAGNWTGTFADLPKYANTSETSDSIGTADLYYYFAAETQINGKDLTDSANVSWNRDTEGSGTAPKGSYGKDTAAVPGVSTWLNTLNPTTLTGTKQWTGDSDSPNSYRPENVKLTLYRQAGTDSEEEVTAASTASGTVPQSTWKKGEEGSDQWTYTYEKLPKYDKDGNLYTYTVTEEQVPGYQRPAYAAAGAGAAAGAAADAAAAGAAAGNKGTITNAVTAITLDKVDEDGKNLNGVKLEIKSGDTTVATWERTESGGVVTTKSGLTGEGKEVRTDGKILGLPAKKTYTVHEAMTPDGYLTAPDAEFTTDEDGKIISVTKNGNLEADEAGLILKVVNTKIKGSVTLTKYLGEKKDGKALPGAEFRLYVQAGGTQNLTSDKPYSSMVYTTGKNGQITVDDLPKGNYYFRETGATADSVLNTDLTSETFSIDGQASEDGLANSVQPKLSGFVENKKFAASVTFAKGDADNENDLITSDVTFVLKYVPAEPAGLAAAIADGSRTAAVGGDGTVTFENLTKGTYTLTEQKPVGYKGGFTCTFAITEGDAGVNELQTLIGKDSGKITEGAMANNVVLNKRETGSVCIEKVDSEDSSKLNGAQFKLEKKDADPAWEYTVESGKSYQCTEDEAGIKFAEITDPAPTVGIVKITGLPWGAYTLTETKAPAGYQLEPGKSVVFTIDRSNIDLTAATDGRQVKNVKNSVTLVKKDSVAAALLLPGAEYSLTGQFRQDDGTAGTAGETKKFTTGADGKCPIPGLLIGGESYTLTETKAPNGYEFPENPTLTFTMGEDGTVKVGGNKATDNQVGISDEKIVLSLEKTGEDGKELTGDSLKGISFKVSGTFAQTAGSTETASITNQQVTVSASDGKLDFSALGGRWLAATGEADAEKFTYTLTETAAPNGYELPAQPTVTFTVDTKGEITITSTDSDAFAIKDDEKDTITVSDIQEGISLTKTDMSGTVIDSQIYGQAEFQVKPAVNGTSFADGKTTEITTSAGDFAEMLKGQLVADNKTQYVLTETKAPNGYVLPDSADALTFAVNTDGTLNFTESGMFAGNAGTELTVKNAPIQLSLVKSDIADTGNSPITDRGTAEFEITPSAPGDTFADKTTAPITVTTEPGGMAALDGKLIPGIDYRMKETVAPLGYQLARTFIFQVNEKGEVIKVKESDGQTDFTKKGFIVKDRKIEVGLLKVSTDTFGKENTSIMDVACSFEITPEPGSKFADGKTDSITMDSANIRDGLDGLLVAGGTYKVHEVHAPEGYKLAGDFTFRISEEGTVAAGSIKNADGEAADAYVKVITDDPNRIWIVVADEPISISFFKRMKDDTETDGLAGADFTLKGKFAGITETEKKWTSGTAAESLKGLLIAGEEYTLTETAAPDGTVPVNDDTKEIFTYTFTVQPDGQAQIVSGDKYLAWDKAKEQLTVSDTPLTLTIFKRGAENEGEAGDPLLKECTFKIEGKKFAPDRYANKTDKTAARSARGGDFPATSDAPEPDSEILFVTTTGTDTGDNNLKGRLLLNVPYVVTELSPSAGYELGLGVTVTITGATVDAEGVAHATVKLAEADKDKGYSIGYDEDGNPVITQRDNPLNLRLKKTDTAGTPLNGAKFVISGVTAGATIKLENGSEVSSYELPLSGYEGAEETKDEARKGIIDLSKMLKESNMPAEREFVYKLEELDGPNGYDRLTKPIFFRLETVEPEDGKMRYSQLTVIYEGVESILQPEDGRTPDAYKDSLTVENKEEASVDGMITLTVKDRRTYIPPATTYHRVAKEWADDNNAKGTRPTSVEVRLYQDGKAMEGKTAKLDPSNGWNYIWYDLELKHEYTAAEITDLTGTGYTAKAETKEDTTTITNTYEGLPPVHVSVTGLKTLENRKLAEGQFSFLLKDQDGKVLDTVTNRADGSFAFKELAFKEADAGKTFTYTVSEVMDGQEGITYDDSSFRVTVTVSQKDGKLTAEQTVTKDGVETPGIRFANKAEPEKTPAPKPTKTPAPTKKPGKTPAPTKKPDKTPTEAPSGGGSTYHPTAIPLYGGSGTSGGSGGGQKAPAKTGDDTMTLFYAALLLASGAMFLLGARRRRKTK